MWIRPWGFKEGYLIGAGLLVTGWLLQITIGEIDWSLFAYPVNIIVLVLYIAGIVAMHCLRKRVYFFGWMSHYTSAVSSLLWVAGITVVMGLIRQLPSGHPADMLGFSRMLSAWPCLPRPVHLADKHRSCPGVPWLSRMRSFLKMSLRWERYSRNTGILKSDA